MSDSTSNVLPLLSDVIASDPQEDVIQSSLAFVRDHLDMEIAYLSEFEGDEIIFRRVIAPGFEDVVFPGHRMLLSEAYCPLILDGRLPELIPDTTKLPLTKSIPMTDLLPIRSHISIPIRRADGSPYGMFCCLSREKRPTLNARDHGVMQAFARLSGETINSKLTDAATRMQVTDQITQVIRERAFDMVYQPIMCSDVRRAKGFEALCRFRAEPYRPPNVWFSEAGQVGLQTDLEICVIQEALKALDQLPAHIYLSVNASPGTITSGRLLDVFKGFPSERIVLELTEHEEVASYEDLLCEVGKLRYQGIRMAIDDAGAGYAGLQQIVRLRPEIIKLDMSLTTDVDKDVVRRSLASALTQFAADTNAIIIAEGVETEAEFAALRDLDVSLMQGYLLGKPADLQTAIDICANPKSVQAIA